METTAELEINIFLAPETFNPAEATDATPGQPPVKTFEQTYLVEMRYSDPRDTYRLPPERGLISINFSAIKNLEDQKGLSAKNRAEQHGAVLQERLFSDPHLKDFVNEKRKIISDRDQQSGDNTNLRIILTLDPATPELHGLRWETLLDPKDNGWLLSKQNVWFSRFLPSKTGEYPALRPRRDLTAVVAVANPSDLTSDDIYFSGPPAGQGLSPINSAAETARAKIALAPAVPDDPSRLKILARSNLNTQPVTLNNLVEALRQGCDIFYLACHGAMQPVPPGGGAAADSRKPMLLLEKDDASGFLVSADDLVDKLRDLPANKLPRLVLLASCESASTGSISDASSALQAVGPQLAGLGIPAVIAMQGKITMETVAVFMPTFFGELVKNGQVDQALSLARGAVKNRPDAWMPVLYMASANGRVWYEPQVITGMENENASSLEQTERLERLWNLLRDKYPSELTPVVGSGLSEGILGPRRRFSSDWADQLKYPLADHDREELERVALFLATNDDPETARSTFRSEFKKHLIRRYAGKINPGDETKDLPTLLEIISTQVWENNPQEPLYMLAGMDFPLYVTASTDRLLWYALKKRGKQPREIFCHWQIGEEADDLTNVVLDDPQQPLIYYLFGKMDRAESLVLSLDDVLDYLINVSIQKGIPRQIIKALTQSSSLFLGFDVDDWSFRVLIRTIVNSENYQMFNKKPHIALQTDPPRDRSRDPKRARRFLERYFNQTNNHFSTFWIRAEDFIAEFYRQVKGIP